MNGIEVDSRHYGYSRFFVEADKLLKYGGENTARVIADNLQQLNSRWYSESGIYRQVHLLIENKTHIEPDGVKITAVSYEPAKILAESAVNGGDINIEILDGGKVIAAGRGLRSERRQAL